MNKNILIVEDEPILREIMKDYFENEGYAVLEAIVVSIRGEGKMARVSIENKGARIPEEHPEKYRKI